MRRTRARLAAVAAVAATLLASAAVGSTPALAQQPAAPAVVDVLPASGSLVDGDVVVAARIVTDRGFDAARLSIDGRAVDASLVRSGAAATLRAPVSLAPGHHRARAVVVVDGTTHSRTWRFDVSTLQPRRIAGADRLATAAAVADELVWGDGLLGTPRAPAAVLARADDGADALSGVGLAHAVGGPLLLTPTAALHDTAADALRDTVAAGAPVYVLGGTAAVADRVVRDVAAQGFDVERIAGPTRVATSVAIAERTSELTGQTAERVVVASGRDFPDALAVSAPAAVRGWPVLLTEPEVLPDELRAHLATVSPDRIEVVGGPAAVSPGVARRLSDLAGVRRTGGDDRYATAGLVADRFPATSPDVALASGTTFADALSGAVLAADRDAGLLLAGARLPPATAARLRDRTGELVVLGGPAAIADRVVTAALSAAVRGVGVRVDPPPGAVLHDDDGRDLPPLRLRIPDAALLDESMASAWVDGREATVSHRVDGDELRVAIRDLPGGLGHGDPAARVRVRATLRTADGRAGHLDEVLRVRHRPALVTTADGYVAVGGRGDVVGRSGTLHRYSLEVEPETGVDPHAFAAEAEAALSDPRGWTASNRDRLQRVPPDEARIRVLLARPATVDRLCARAGLRTGGVYSCWNGRIAALNLARWNGGARGFDAPLPTYRRYLVNHEVGHGLGNGHRGCPAAGALAPVMMQQTKGTGACRPNPWPYP